MKVWWCHRYESNPVLSCTRDRLSAVGHEECGEMQLVPEGALVLEKVDGEWPKWAFEQLDYWIMNSGDFVELFDALANQVGESE